ncbi:hypothetical protein EPI10_021640 [Gossypium australe]|uniref:Uncharacterized protein n=1 Tax=Gossypium australe TaxID=47621 RepID=A0A5B6WIL8_9ROSI|nr:hypothetical protein EPI10_021640 [Gossypium australe]
MELGSDIEAIRRIKNKLRQIKPQILFLIETKKVLGKCSGLDKKVDAEGSRSGLSLGWNNGCIIQLRSYLVLHIDVEIDEGDEADK